MASEVSNERYEEILEAYKTVAKTPFIEQGWVKPELPTTVMIQYSQRDLPRNKKNKIVRSFFEGESFSFKPFPFAMNMTNVIMMEPSPSWAQLAVLRSIKEPSDEAEKYLLEIWDNGSVAVAIPTDGKHGQVYADQQFGSLVWSSDEKFIAYIAERNPAKGKTFYPSKPSDSTSNSSGGNGDSTQDKKAERAGSKFEFKEDWGEQYKGGNPSIFLASLEKETVEIVPGIPETLSAGQVQFAPRSTHLVFTGWNSDMRRLGLIYCYNRPAALYAVPIDVQQMFETTKTGDSCKESKVVQLTHANKTSRSPRFSTDGSYIVFLANNLEVHHGCSKLMTIQWNVSNFQTESRESTSSISATSTSTSHAKPTVSYKGEEKVIIDIVKNYPNDPSDFPGLYVINLPNRCFIEDNKIMFSSHWRSLIVPLLVDIQTGSLRKINIPGCSTSNLNVQDVRKDVCALFDGSEINRIPFNFVGRWDKSKAIFKDWKVTPHSPAITTHAITMSELSWECINAPLPSSDVYNCRIEAPQQPAPGIEYVLTLPADTSPPSPVILFPHGGPHSATIPLFSISVAFLASIGYAVIQVNYRGSIGFGQDFVESLPGNVGHMDVNDCLLVLEHALSSKPEVLDRSRCYVMGGSHGGFLTGHLLARSSDVEWKAGVLINAVTNMAHCVGISDIPDWCHVESGASELKDGGIQRMFEMSPIAKVDKVKAPALVVWGTADKRVPPSQSIEYYHALRKRGIETKMLKYPNAIHAITEPEQEADYLINSALWFESHI